MTLRHRDQPILTLRLRCVSCRCEARLNDVPIFENPLGRSATAVIPVNEWLEAGRNELRLVIRPLPVYLDNGTEDFAKETLSPHAAVEVAITAKKAGAAAAAETVLGTLQFRQRDTVPRPDFEGLPRGVESSSAAVEDTAAVEGQLVLPCSLVAVTKDEASKSVSVERTFLLPEDRPKWLWQTALPVAPGPGSAFVLTRLYQQVWTHLSQGIWTELERLTEPKIRDLTAAYYLDASRAKEIFGLERLFADGRLLPFPTRPCRAEVFGRGKLVRLLAHDGLSPIRFATPDGLWHVVNLTFANFGSNWLVVR